MVISNLKKIVLVLLALLVLSLMSFSHASLSEERVLYQKLQEAWQAKQPDEVNKLTQQLKDYPLYPYIQYRNLLDNIASANAADITLFIKQHANIPIGRTLSTQFANELLRRNDWTGYLNWVKTLPSGLTDRCNYYYAQWMSGKQKETMTPISALWLTGRNLPAGCQAVVDVWTKAGGQTTALTLKRIKLAFEQNNFTLAKSLINDLPANHKTLKSVLNQVISDPKKLPLVIDKLTPSNLTRSVVKSTFSRLARVDITQAQKLLPLIVTQQKLGSDDQRLLNETIAWQLFSVDLPDKQSQYRDDIISKSHNVDLIERRIRFALAQGDRQQIVHWINQLPPADQHKERWQYWLADYFMANKQGEKAREIWRALAEKRGFYPVLSAQRLHQDYVIKSTKVSSVDVKLFDSDPTILRIKELLYWQEHDRAAAEWRNYVSHQDKVKQEQLASYALGQKWADFSIQSTIIGKFWDHLEERFPVTYHDMFDRAVAKKEITMYYAMAIARQESGFNPRVCSPVGARGLMQLMPATAKDAAKMANLADYSNPSQLFDPEINIWLGTSYLDYVFQRFDKNRVLATAAYNAGPTRVDRWLKASSDKLNVAAFIESMPYNETRNYVQNVLTYDVFYRYFLGEKSVHMFTDSEWNRHY